MHSDRKKRDIGATFFDYLNTYRNIIEGGSHRPEKSRKVWILLDVFAFIGFNKVVVAGVILAVAAVALAVMEMAGLVAAVALALAVAVTLWAMEVAVVVIAWQWQQSRQQRL